MLKILLLAFHVKDSKYFCSFLLETILVHDNRGNKCYYYLYVHDSHNSGINFQNMISSYSKDTKILTYVEYNVTTAGAMYSVTL